MKRKYVGNISMNNVKVKTEASDALYRMIKIIDIDLKVNTVWLILCNYASVWILSFRILSTKLWVMKIYYTATLF